LPWAGMCCPFGATDGGSSFSPPPAPTGRRISAQGNALGSRFIEGPRSEGTPHGSAGAHCAFGAKDGRGVGAEPSSVVCRVDRAVFVRWGYAAFLQNAVLVLGKGTQGVALGWYVLPLRGNGWSQLVLAPTGRRISAQGNALGSRFIEGPRSEGTPHRSAGAHCPFGATDGRRVGALRRRQMCGSLHQ
jgi:hypothetical protein